MQISIIICFYERLLYLEKCLASLQFSSKNFDEVVIADDGSCEMTVNKLKPLIAKYDYPITHAWQARNGARRAASRNNGIRHAKGDLLIFIDADFIMLPGAIRSHSEGATPGMFSAGRCKYLPEELSQRFFATPLTPYLLKSLYGTLPERPIIREHREFFAYSMMRRFLWINERKPTFGGHFSAFRENLYTINGYDENFVGWGGEDQDLALRMLKAGFIGRSVIRKAKAMHLWHPKEMGNKHWKEGTNTAYFNRQDIAVFCENGLT